MSCSRIRETSARFSEWLEHTRNALVTAGAGDLTVAEWFGLPSPMFRTTRDFDTSEVQRAVTARTAWLATTTRSLAGGNGTHTTDVALLSGSHAANNRAVFVVHGRNKALRDAMFAFLRSIGLEPLEWSVAVRTTKKASPYIGEVLDSAFGAAQAVVVLLTPDDETRLRPDLIQVNDPPHEREFTHQARPNVLFEAGLAFGRFPNRTVLVEVGNLRPFSDVGGRHVVRLSNASQHRQDLAMRLEDAGCAVNLTGTDWHTVGNFGIDQPPIAAPAKKLKLSETALAVLEAAKMDGQILIARTYSGTHIQTGGADIVDDPGDPRRVARVEYALRELEESGLIERKSDELFELTHLGFEFVGSSSADKVAQDTAATASP